MEEQPDNSPGAIRPWLLILIIIVLLVAAGFLTWYYMGKNKTTPTTATTPTVKTTPAVTVKPTDTSKVTWQTTTIDKISVDYPSTWFTKNNQFSTIFTNKKECLNSPTNSCEIIAFLFSDESVRQEQNKKLEAELGKDANFTKEVITSDTININTYWSSKINDFRAFFGNNNYQAGTNTSKDTLKKMLTTIKIAS